MTGFSRSNVMQGKAAVTPMLWVVLIAALSVGGSYIYTCATPFAAIGALAARKMDRGTGLTLVALVWIANQLVGYGLLDYPQTANSIAWGGAIGLAAGAGFFAARTIGNLGWTNAASAAASFVVAFIVYEAALYAAGFVLGGADAFSFEIVARVFFINAVAFVAALALYRIAEALRSGHRKETTARA